MIRLPFWPPIHLFLVKNQALIKKLFFAVYIFAIVFIVLGFYLFANQFSVYLLFYELAGKFGTIAMLLFVTTLMPGIFQRFKILPLFSASIVLFRRQIGILMYFIAMVHSMYISSIPLISTSSFSLESLPPNGLTGVLTLSILFPVWITSNDISQKKFGKFWKTIQRLTYFAMITLFFHVAMVERSAAAILAVTIFLEVASWIKVWVTKPKVNTPDNSSTSLQA